MANSPFGVDRPEDSPGLLLWQTTITWQRLIKKALESYELSHAQFVIMAIMLWFETQNHAITQTDIIRQSKLDKMTVSKSLKKLTAESYVHRVEHPLDTRAKSVSLTTKGKKLIATLIPIIEKIDTDFFGQIPRTQQFAFLNSLNALVSSKN